MRPIKEIENAMISAIGELGEGLGICRNENLDTFQGGKEKIYNGYCKIGAIHDELINLQFHLIKIKAEEDNPDKDQGDEDAHQFSDEYKP